MASSKGMYVRVKARTQKALKMIVGKLQLETGEDATADSAIWDMIEKMHPDIADRVTSSDDDDAPKKDIKKQ